MRARISGLVVAIMLAACSSGTHTVYVVRERPVLVSPPPAAPPPPAPVVVQPLEIALGRPSMRSVPVQTNRAAYVAIFEITPQEGVTLVHPSTPRQARMMMSGLSSVPVWWESQPTGARGGGAARPARPTRYIYALASERPLRLIDSAFVPGYLDRVLGPSARRAAAPQPAMRALARHFAPAAIGGRWAEDLYTLAPSTETSPRRVARIHCPGGTVYEVPEDIADRAWCPVQGSPAQNTAGNTPARPDSVIGPTGRLVNRRIGDVISRAVGDQADKDKADKDKADKDKADKDKADKERADADKADRGRSEKEKAEKYQRDQQQSEADRAAKDHAEKERVLKERADKERADKEYAQKDQVERERVEKEKTEKENVAKADKDKADKDKADKDKADKDKADKDKADKDKADKDKADKDKADKAAKEHADHEKAEKERTDREAADSAVAARERTEAENVRIEKEKASHEKAEKEKAENEKAAKAKAETEKAEKENAEKEKAEKDKADKDKADKLKADNEKAEKDKAEKEKAAKSGKAGPPDESVEASAGQDSTGAPDAVKAKQKGKRPGPPKAGPPTR